VSISYCLTAVASNAAGNAITPARIRFRARGTAASHARFAGRLAGVYSGALAPDGKLVLAGAGLIGGLPGALVARLLPDPPLVTDDGGPASGGGGPAADTRAPVVGALKGTRKAAGKRARIAFSLSEPARVRLSLKRRGRPALRFDVDGRAGSIGRAGPESSRPGATGSPQRRPTLPATRARSRTSASCRDRGLGRRDRRTAVSNPQHSRHTP
jgi:hypothetical protein